MATQSVKNFFSESSRKFDNSLILLDRDLTLTDKIENLLQSKALL